MYRYQGVSYGWVVTIASFAMATSIGILNGYGIFFLPIVTEFKLSTADASSIYSFALLGEVLGGIIGGWLNDRLGPRPIGIGGAILLSGGLITGGLANNLFELYLAYSLLAGLGWGFLVVPPTVAILGWFVKRRGVAVGIATAGSGVGTLVFSPLIQVMIEGFGWRTAFIGLGIGVLPVMLLSSFLIRESPQEMRSKLKIDEADPPFVPSNQNSPKAGAIRSSLFCFIYSAQLLGALSLNVFLIYIVPYCVRLGFSQGMASNALAILGVSSILGRIGMGPLSDRLGRLKSLALVYGLFSVALFVLPLVTTLSLIYATSIIAGLALGGLIPGNITAIGDIFHSNSMGRVLGVQSSAFGFGGMVGPIMAGLVLDTSGSYQPAFWIASGVSLLAMALVFAKRNIA